MSVQSAIPAIGFAAILALVFFTRPGFAPQGPTVPDITGASASAKQSGKEAVPVAIFTPDDSVRLPGIDVSHYQGKINWDKVAASGVAFAYSKTTQGITGVDSRYAVNLSGATAAGVPFGSYHFFEPDDDPVKQAEHFLSVAKIGAGSMPPVLDVEKTPKTASSAAFSKSILTWLNKVEAETNCAPLIYASPSFFSEHFDATLDGTPYWLAEYASAPRPPSGDKTWVLWQHSSSGSVKGISGQVDLDWFAGDANALKEFLCT